MTVIQSLNWRASIKQFDTSKKLQAADVEKLVEAANLTASSGGLQPFKLVVVSNDAIKKELVAASFNQAQVADASHLLVFAIEENIDESLVDRYIERAIEVRGVGKESLHGFAHSMKMYIQSIDTANRQAWAKNQAYIALGTVMVAAADLKIDTCPMEGFNPVAYQEALGLKDKGLMPVVILPVGYRSEEDVYSKAEKVRKTRDNFVIEIN